MRERPLVPVLERLVAIRDWSLIALLALLALAVLWHALATAQPYEGRHGVGHENWHADFYSKLMRKNTRTSCCNLIDCVPTQSRMVGDRHEVLVEGEWTPVPPETIQPVTAPDGGAHVCFPKPGAHYPKGTIFCVVLPPEG